METNENSSLPETLQVVKIDSKTGNEYVFQGVAVKIDTSHTSDMPAERFLIYALRRMLTLGRGDEMEQQARQIIPIFDSLLGEVTIKAHAQEGGTNLRYDFQYLLKDGIYGTLYEVEKLRDIGETPLSEAESEENRLFFMSLLKEAFEVQAVQLSMAVYVDIHREKLIKSLSPQKKRNRGKVEPKDQRPFRVSGHFIDQKLRYSQPAMNTLVLFESLRNETKDAIHSLKVERSTVVEGIKLTSSENKVIDSLCKLLHLKSQTSDEKSADFYTGNKEALSMPYGVDRRHEPAPHLAFTLYELTKEFKGVEAPSGKDISNVGSILVELEKKRFLISYIEKIYKEGGKRTERKIEEFQTLIKLMNYSETDYNSNNDVIDEKREIIVALSPIFRHQIDSKFILYPHDINRRTILAYGSHNIANASHLLRDYLMRELSYGHTKAEINIENLYWMLCDKWMKEKRRKKVTEYVNKAIQTSTELGLLAKHEIVTGSAGQLKAVFHLNKEWN